MKWTCAILLQLLVVGVAVADVGSDIDLDQLKSHLPGDIQIPTVLENTTAVITTVKTMFKDKCDKVHASEEAVKKVENGALELSECLQGIINVTAIQQEIEIAKPQGELDTVFHKYCGKRPEIMKCVDDFNEKIKVCLDAEERKSDDEIMKKVNKLLDFVCYKGGDQIALFFAERGPECLQEKADEIQQCLNVTFSPYIPKDGFDTQDGKVKIPKLVIGPKQHEDLEKLKVCIVAALEKCEDITPANIIESMFKFIQVEGSKEEEVSGSVLSVPPLHVNILLLCLLGSISHRLFPRRNLI